MLENGVKYVMKKKKRNLSNEQDQKEPIVKYL